MMKSGKTTLNTQSMQCKAGSSKEAVIETPHFQPILQADSFSTESTGKPKNTGVGSLSFLQRIFLIQESNRGLLHCR